MGTVQVSIQPHEMGTPRQSPIEEKRHTRVDLVRDTGLFACVVNIDAGLARRRVAGLVARRRPVPPCTVIRDKRDFDKILIKARREVRRSTLNVQLDWRIGI